MMLFSESKRMSRAIWLPLLLLIGLNNLTCQAGDSSSLGPDLEPPFPVPIYNNGGRMYLVSEEFDSQSGYLTREEYVDLTIGKATFSSTKSSRRETFHMDATTQSSYYYTPYQCKVYHYPSKPLNMPDESGLWVREQWARSMSDSWPTKLYLTGVTAVWLNAERLPKVYSNASHSYSASKDTLAPAHKWTAKLGNTTASFYFHETINHDTEPSLTLETIELETENPREKTTINVLAYGFDLEDSVYQKELQLPLSYGCYEIGVVTEQATNLIYQLKSAEIPDRLRLEAVATSLTDGRRSTETVSLEIAHSPPSLNYGDDKLSIQMQLVRQRSSKVDIKSVVDHILGVKYEIDNLKGTCKISNARDTHFRLNETWISVSFPNGLVLEMNENLMDVLFFKLDKFQFTKSVDGDGIKYVYMTLTKSDLFDGGDEIPKSARIVRKYSIKDEYLVKLDSVSLWLLNEPASSKSDIREIYHFTLLENDQFFGATEELASVFDISEECYVDNENEMKYGRDYNWLELHYSVASNVLKRISPQWTGYIKQLFYDNMRRYAYIGFSRLPRVELLFDEVGFALRFLLLDSPPLNMIFDRADNTTIEPPETDDKREYFSEIAPDLRHCSELCRLNRCLAFSFCDKSYSCLLAHLSAQNSSSFNSTSTRMVVVQKRGCSLFRQPPEFDYSRYHESRLHNFIGQMQRHDLNSLLLPQLPEELSVPRSESRISVREEAELQIVYERTVREYLDGTGLNSVSLLSRSLICVPDRFEAEQDPLAEFGLDGRDELRPEDEWLAPAFHEGLSQYKFDYRTLSDEAGDNKQAAARAAGDQRREARRYVGVDYEQCELACLDGKCSSFSYCQQRQECTITNIWDLQPNKDANTIQADADCAIVQRDFLSKFHKLSQVKRPAAATAAPNDGAKLHVARGINPSECAHGCVVESNYNCLAFTFCQNNENNNRAGTCYYSESRALQPSQVQDGDLAESTTGCDHYSRSYLADFTRIEYREIRPDALDELKTSLVESQSVDRCAELCATELIDCTAFQFCHNPEAEQQQEARQRCTMIESPPADKNDDYRVVLDEDGKVFQAGKLFVSNQNCHVFSLRKGSSEAELRQLALNPLSKGERGDQDPAQWSNGLSFGAAVLLFLCSTLVFSAMGVALVVAQRNSARLRSRLDHLRALVGRYR